MSYLVRHIMLDFYGCSFETLDNPEYLEGVLREVTALLHTDVFAHTEHQFEPYGVSCMMVVGASHLAIHTWPEHNYACVDVVVCTENFQVSDIESRIFERLQAKSSNIMEVRRGMIEAN